MLACSCVSWAPTVDADVRVFCVIASLRRDAFGRVINSQKEVVAVVHQVDRSPALESMYRGMYPMIPPHLRDTKG